MRVLKLLLDQGVIVVCAGGGGIPVVRRAVGSLIGVEAVIDKDAASALLAAGVGEDALPMLTDVDGVHDYWGTPQQTRIEHMTPAEARKRRDSAGSMEPKVEAATAFVSNGGMLAGIGKLENALTILKGRAGTVIDDSYMEIGHLR